MNVDNIAIARIAAHDLEGVANNLIGRYRGNDDVIFFLGRVAWQGEMVACLPELQGIAIDKARGAYARIASIRAVMALGLDPQKYDLFAALVRDEELLDRRFLAELLKWAPRSRRSVELLLQSLERLAPREQYEVFGLSDSLHQFIGELPLMSDATPEQPLAALVDGLVGLLRRPPYVERANCRVSDAHSWLMSPALYAVDRLVAARAVHALQASVLFVLQSAPTLATWRSHEFGDHVTALEKSVPRWVDLNDALYWFSVGDRRRRLAEEGKKLTDDFQIAFWGHFWRLEPDDFDRCLGWVTSKTDLDDQLVALSRCARIYVVADRPKEQLEQMRMAVSGNPQLEASLDAHLNPVIPPERLEYDAKHAEWQREHEERKGEEGGKRAEWIRELKAKPDRVRHPPDLKPDDFSRDQYYLINEIFNRGAAFHRHDEENWQVLIPEFGQEVAEAYRDAAVAYWRNYQPEIRSEGADAGKTPYALLFAMSGLAVEARANAAFALSLTDDEVKHALRYAMWELNGFPIWFEGLYRAHRDVAREFLERELTWELNNTPEKGDMNYLLRDIVFHAPWLHGELAPFVMNWLKQHDAANDEALRLCLSILTGGGVDAQDLSALAVSRIADASPAQQARWYAVWVDCDASAGIHALARTLERLEDAHASEFAQHFAVDLIGDRYGTGDRHESFRTAEHLKSLYLLMHRYVRTFDDLKRANTGAYSPTLRDNAQDARDRLLTMLAEMPGRETYAALKELESNHPNPNHRKWMAMKAHARALADADEPAWAPAEVRAFTVRDR